MFKPIEQLVVPVVDALTGLQVMIPRPNSNGGVDLKQRVYRVSPLKAHWPNVRVIIIDWSRAIADLERTIREEISDAKSRGEATPNYTNEYNRRLIQLVKQPVNFEGIDYWGYFGWGSAVKRLQTLGLDKDIGVESGLAEIAEDASRYLRAFLPSSLYGGGWLSSARVLVLKDRTEWNGYMIADGFGLIKRSIHEALRNHESNPIQLGNGRQNYLGWQRFTWDDIKDEATPLILDHLEEVGSPNWVLTKIDANAGGYKRELVDIDEDMLKHPYLKLSANISVKKMFQELGTTVPLPTFVRVAVPTKLDTVVWGGDEKLIISRHPMDSWQSQMAVVIKKSAEWERELELISSMVLIQTTETSPTTHAKGVRAVVDDEIMGEYDLVVSEEDFKMLANRSVRAFRKGKMRSETINDLVIAFTQEYVPGSAFGVPPESWKDQGGDFDGDMGFLSPCSAYPRIWNAARSWLGRDKTWKIKKARSDMAKRPEMLVAVFGNNVGFATNVVSTTFVRQPNDRQPVADALFNGGVIFEPTIERLDKWCNRVIKTMTDGFKSMVNMAAEHTILRKAQQVISSNFGGTASWALWSQDRIPAFTSIVPMFYHQLDPQTVKWLDEDADNRRQPEYRLHIPPEQYEGTCAKIYELVQPWILDQYRKTIGDAKYTFMEMLDVLPGSHFIGWAPHVPDNLLNLGLEMVREFSGLSRMVTWSSAEDTQSFKETWQQMCSHWALQFASREEAVYVLWRAAHHATIEGNSASAVFMGFPVEAKKIVAEKPGLLEQQEQGVVALLVGVDYNFVGNAPDMFGPVQAYVYEIPWKGAQRLAVVLDEPLDGMKESDRVPLGTVGMCAEELRESGHFYTNPLPGAYIARFKRNKSGKSFRAYLNPLG